MIEEEYSAHRKRALPRPFNFHWGGGQIAEEATFVSQYHEPTIQLLEYEDGSLTIRFCSYGHRGQFMRSPMMADAQDLKGLREALKATPRLWALLKEMVD